MSEIEPPHPKCICIMEGGGSKSFHKHTKGKNIRMQEYDADGNSSEFQH